MADAERVANAIVAENSVCILDDGMQLVAHGLFRCSLNSNRDGYHVQRMRGVSRGTRQALPVSKAGWACEDGRADIRVDVEKRIAVRRCRLLLAEGVEAHDLRAAVVLLGLVVAVLGSGRYGCRRLLQLRRCR